jgi:hypothetical protein
MGLLDRFLPKNAARPPSTVHPDPAAPVSAPEIAPASAAPEEAPASPPLTAPLSPGPAPETTPVAALALATGGAVLAQLKAAREALEFKDRAGAMAIYEEVLAAAGDRADILVTISGDLGVTGHTREIIELVAPRYDAKRHGPATGVNLLQAYLAVRDPESAQHVLDLLFALNRAGLQERLLGFSNVIADMMLLGGENAAVAAASAGPAAAEESAADTTQRIDLVNISKPIWFYGLESLPGLLPPKAGKLRRVAFGQLALLGLKDIAAIMKQPEDELGRLSRGIPLWLSETLFFSANYSSFAAVATMRREHYGLFSAEWAPEHIRQLVESAEEGIDFVFTGALQQKHADYELVLRLWEVKKFRERKSFLVRWTPATADQVLAEFHVQLRTFMEFMPYPAGQGISYAPPAKLRDYIEALGAGLTHFLVEKQVLPAAQLTMPAELAARVNAAAADSEIASLLALGLHARAQRLGAAAPPLPLALAATPVVEQARQIWSP